jgi:hypothetical protein
MLKLYFVASLLGQNVMTIGPLPYDMAECERRLEMYQVEVDAGLAECKMTMQGLCVQPGQLALECREAATRPPITELMR